jgi:hypothetical protein
MADDPRIDAQPGGVDDDRLLAYALGLDDDPELARAAEADEELSLRLEAVRADVAAVAAGVRAAVPLPDDGYTDLGDPRWAQLQEFFTPRAEKPVKASRGSRRWLRVLAPVVAVAVAVAVGVTLVQRQAAERTSVAERGSKTADALGAAGGAMIAGSATSAGSPAPEGGSAAEGAPVAGSPVSGETAPPSTPLTRLAALHDQMDDFALIVLATARRATDGFQDFLVLKVFRGNSPRVLRLELAGRLADVGSLQLLLLRPLSSSRGAPEPGSGPQSGEEWAGGSGDTSETAGPVPSAIATTAAVEMFGSTTAVMYRFEGDMAVARELPVGTDPATVTLP